MNLKRNDSSVIRKLQENGSTRQEESLLIFFRRLFLHVMLRVAKRYRGMIILNLIENTTLIFVFEIVVCWKY